MNQTKTSLLLSMLALLSLVAASPARSQEVAAPEATSGAHVKWGLGYFGGASSFWNSAETGNADLLGLYGRVGLQATQRFGVEAELAGGTCVFTSEGQASLFADFAPASWVSFSAGPTVGSHYGMSLCWWNCSADHSEAIGSFGGTAKVDFLLGHLTDDGTRHRAFDIGLEYQIGAQQQVYSSPNYPYSPASTALTYGQAFYVMLGVAQY